MKKLERIIRNGKNALVGTGLLASVACSSVGTQLGRDLVLTGAYGFVGSAANEAGRRSAGGKDPSVTMNNYNGESQREVQYFEDVFVMKWQDLNGDQLV